MTVSPTAGTGQRGLARAGRADEAGVLPAQRGQHQQPARPVPPNPR